MLQNRPSFDFGRDDSVLAAPRGQIASLRSLRRQRWQNYFGSGRLSRIQEGKKEEERVEEKDCESQIRVKVQNLTH